MPCPGFEPVASSLLSRDSTTELQMCSHLVSEILNIWTKDKAGSGPVLQSYQVLKKWRWEMKNETPFSSSLKYHGNIDHFLPNFYVNPVETT